MNIINAIRENSVLAAGLGLASVVAGLSLVAKPVTPDRILTPAALEWYQETRTPTWENKTNTGQYHLGLVLMAGGMIPVGMAAHKVWAESRPTKHAALPEPTEQPLPAMERRQPQPSPESVAIPGELRLQPLELTPLPQAMPTESEQGGISGINLGPIADFVGTEQDKHLCLVTSTQCGKTTTTRAIIYAILQQHPEADIRVIDPKHSTWMGLEDAGRVAYALDGTGRLNPQPAERMIQGALAELRSRIAAQDKTRPPLYLFIDEWASLKPLLEKQTLDEDIFQLLNMGLEFKCYLFLVTQSWLAGEIGVSTATRNNMKFASLGRGEDYDAIEGMIGDNWLISNKQKRQELSTRLRDVKADAQRNNPHIPVCLVTATGRIEQLPDFSWLEGYRIPVAGAEEEEALTSPLFRMTVTLPADPALQWLLSYVDRKRREGKDELQVSDIIAARSPQFPNAAIVRAALEELSEQDYIAYNPSGAGRFSLLGAVELEEGKFRSFQSA